MARVLEGRNRASAEEAASFVDQYEELEKKVASIMSRAMSECKKVREEQRELLDDAKTQGVPKKVVKTIADARKLEGKAKAKMDSLEPDELSQAVDIRKVLGDFADLPLGQAAVASDDDRTSAVISAVKRDLSQSEKDAWDQAAPAGSA